jgi:adenine specific DNA methylase Mod
MGRFPANLLVSDDVLDDGKKRKAVPKGGFGAMDIGIGKPGETQKYRKKKMTMPDLRDVGKKSKEAIGIDKLSFGQVENAERKDYEMWDIQEDDIGYSRYFSLDTWFSKNIKQLPEPVQKTFPFMIVPKASKSEKNDGLDNFEEQFKAGADFRPNHKEKALKGEDGNPYGRWNKIKNIHPTVKPLTLMNYLVTLGSRKGDVVLDPFMGSGTTPLACVSLERKYIGIDNEEDYYEIAKARVDKLEAPLKMWEKFS